MKGKNKKLYLGGVRVLGFVTLFSLANVQLSYSQQWVQLGGGADDIVITIYHDSIADLLYVGGIFQSPYQMIMNWDGTSFNSMGNNALEFLSANDMIHYNGDLVVVGSGFPPSENYVYHSASWDGNSWTQMSFDYGTSSALGVFEVDMHSPLNSGTWVYIARIYNSEVRKTIEVKGIEELIDLQFIVNNAVRQIKESITDNKYRRRKL